MSYLRILLALAVAGCASTGPATSDNPISCTATCQTTYTQCSSGCVASRADTTASCQATCDRVLEECLRGCESPPPDQP